MKFKMIFCFICVIPFFSFGQPAATYNEMIIGNWNYDIAYDTIATARSVDTARLPDDTLPMFISRLKIKKEGAILFTGTKKIKCTWQILNKQISFHFDNSKSLTYQITNLTSTLLGLKESGGYESTLGYKKE